MAFLPELAEIGVTRSVTDTFGGYNHNLRIGDGEFYDMKNMSSDLYPLLAPREKRRRVIEGTDAYGISGIVSVGDTFCYTEGTDIIVGGERIHPNLKPGTYKTLVVMGAYVIVLPDKKWVNTADMSYGDIEASYRSTDTVVLRICTLDGAEITGTPAQANAPTDPSNLDYWIDTSSVPHTLKQYSESSGMWVSVPTSYVKISATGIGKNFQEYDGVRITGFESSSEDENWKKSVEGLNGDKIIWAKGDDYIVVPGIIDRNFTYSNTISVTREMPDMDFVIEAGNRLWGCKYDVNTPGMLNEIYSSKLGDFRNWRCYMGLSTDSYTVSVGAGGFFTGAVNYLGTPIFFKDDRMYKIYNSNPPYQVQELVCNGVSGNASDSLAVVNNVLYYKSTDGIYAYDGSMPTCISYVLGNERYVSAVAGTRNYKYYVSLEKVFGSGDADLMVYDTVKKLWHKEDKTSFRQCCAHNGRLYYVADDKTTELRCIGDDGDVTEDSVEWMLETGILSAEYPDKKYISRLLIRLSLEIGARADFYIQYDSEGEWVKACSFRGTSLRSFSVPVRPRRCDHLRLRIEGQGDVKIYSIVKSIEQGSDL